MARDATGARAATPARQEETAAPMGTWAILLGYAVVIVGLWGYGFLMLLARR